MDVSDSTDNPSRKRKSLTRRFLSQCRAIAVFLLVVINTVFWSIPIYLLAFFKLILPIRIVRKGLHTALMWCASGWISVNDLLLKSYRGMHWNVQEMPDLERQGSYLVNCNHQSWVDILVLQSTFNRRIPFMRFFIKQELIWVPFLGMAWWALDFPFMRRYTKSQLERNPALKKKDLETTRKVCERLSSIPLSVMNFLEGTRFTDDKHDAQQSPYRHLLKPKLGGLSVALTTLRDKMQTLLDVTIVYPEGRPTLWSMLRGELGRVLVDIRQIRIPDALLGRDRDDPSYREALQQWVNQLWRDKDELIDRLLSRQGSAAQPVRS